MQRRHGSTLGATWIGEHGRNNSVALIPPPVAVVAHLRVALYWANAVGSCVRARFFELTARPVFVALYLC